AGSGAGNRQSRAGASVVLAARCRGCPGRGGHAAGRRARGWIRRVRDVASGGRCGSRPGARREAAMKDFLRWLKDLAHWLGRGLDWPLLIALGALMGIGLAVLDSAGGSGLVMAQGARFGVGLVAMWAIARVPILRIRAWTPLVYAISM